MNSNDIYILVYATLQYYATPNTLCNFPSHYSMPKTLFNFLNFPQNIMILKHSLTPPKLFYSEYLLPQHL